MRMWSADPELMCNKHLFGEHVEMHMFLGALKKKKSIAGYIDGNLVEPLIIKERHDLLVSEIIALGYKHHTPMENIDVHLKYLSEEDRLHQLDRDASEQELFSRCPKCREIKDRLSCEKDNVKRTQKTDGEIYASGRLRKVAVGVDIKISLLTKRFLS